VREKCLLRSRSSNQLASIVAALVIHHIVIFTAFGDIPVIYADSGELATEMFASCCRSVLKR
jgi:hypothetical protein